MRVFLISFFLLSSTLQAELSTLEALTSEWVGLRTARAREAEAWRDEQSRVRLELSLLEEAESRLREELEQLEARGDETEAQQADLLRELSARDAAMDELRRGTERSGQLLEVLLAQLPRPLRAHLADERDSLESAGEDSLQKYRALLAIRNRLLQLQTQLHVTPTLIELDGQRREMDVLWIGSAYALAVSGDLARAARGSRTDGEWQWQALPQQAQNIRHAVRLVQGDAPPAMLTLPLELPMGLSDELSDEISGEATP